MPTLFTPDCALGLEVQKLLLDKPEGLSVAEIRRSLRLKGKHIEEHHLRQLLAHPKVFTSLSQDRFCMLQTEAITAASGPERPNEKTPGGQLLLANLPHARTDFIVIDLETTGLNPSQEAIIQLVAIRYRAGQPVAALNLYANPAPRSIALGLERKLHLDQLPQVKAAIMTAAPFAEQVETVRDWLGDLPLVAHNARFEQGFLQTALGSLINPIIDTMELAVLLHPTLSDHKLETVAKTVGVGFDDAAQVWQQAGGADEGLTIGAETLHNAVTDTSLLAAVYQKLLTQLDKTDTLLRHLLPEIRGQSWQTGFDIRPFLHFQTISVGQETVYPPQIDLATSAEAVQDLLANYRTAREMSYRAGQAQMAEQVRVALDESRFKLIEAPTGTGKSLAYLVPASLHAMTSGAPIAISTAYRNLQDQLIGEIKEYQRSLNLPLNYEVLKGKANYVCHQRLAQYVASLDGHSSLAERYVLAYLLERAANSPESTLDDVTFWLTSTFPIASHVYQAVSAADGCGGLACDELGCYLPEVTRRAQTAHLVLINHDLWLSDATRLPKFSQIIVDEAHTLEDVATRASTEEVSRATLEAIFNRLRDDMTGRGLLIRLLAGPQAASLREAINPILAALGRLRPIVVEFGSQLAEYIKLCQGRFEPAQGVAWQMRGDPRTVDSVRWSRFENARAQLFDLHLPDLLNLLEKLRQRLTTLPDNAMWLSETELICQSLADQLQLQRDILRVKRQSQVYWLEIAPTEEDKPPAWAAKTAPIRVDGFLQEFYDKLESVVLVSATLAVRGGDFSFFVDRLGLAERLKPDDTHIIQGDLDYAANAFLGLPSYLTYTPNERTMQSFQEEVARELELLLELTDGRALGLFTARSRMEAVQKRLEPTLTRLGIPLYWQNIGESRKRLQEDFKSQVESVLLGLLSFWEGVDVPGESLSFVIMEKLPFPFMFDPVFKARREDVLKRGQHEFNDFIFPLMALRFKQGFGRLLRRKDDRGAVIVLDKRLHRKNYKYELLDSLPGFMPRREEAERSRRSFYQALIDNLPGLIKGDKQSFLDHLPDSLTLDIMAKLAEFQLPARISPDEYETWRPIILQALQIIFKHDTFRSAEQEAAVRAILTGQDVLALLPTGAGKSLCYQLTALLRPGLTLIFSPLIALMRDQVQALNARGIEIVGAIYSGQRADEREEILSRVQRGQLKLLYIAPERLRDPYLLEALRNAQIAQMVVDEAHCVAMWGPSFRPDFLYLPRLFAGLPVRPPVAAFTATATPPIRTEIAQALELHNPVSVVADFDRPNLRFVVYNARSKYNPVKSKNERLAVLLRILTAADQKRENVLIYVATTVEAELLARRLQQAGYEARAYHGKLTSAERDNVQELFMDDQINIVVCTKAFGMGIDKPDIRYVIHYNLPGDIESYYQEAGRAGRQGDELAYCVLLYHPSDQRVHEFFSANSRPDPQLLNELADKLRRLPGQRLYLNPLVLIEELELDEVQLKIGLHLLEQAQLIRREADFSLRGSLTLRATPEDIAAELSQTDPDSYELWQLINQKLGWPTFRRFELDLLETAQTLQTTPEILDRLLVRLAVGELVIYRPWEKGFIVHKQVALENFRFELNAAFNDQMTRKLAVMSSYAEADRPNAAINCRRAFVLNYFGQSKAVRCGNCDLCDPEQVYPWSMTTARDVAGLADYFDPAFSWLEIIQWNMEQTRPGFSPYSAATLKLVLMGNAYQLANKYSDPHIRQWRLRRLRACPLWSVFESLSRADMVLDKSLERLMAEGFVETAQQPLNNGQTYNYLTLTATGRDRLLSGELFQWES